MSNSNWERESARWGVVNDETKKNKKKKEKRKKKRKKKRKINFINKEFQEFKNENP